MQNDLHQHTLINHPYKLHFPQSLLSFFKPHIPQPLNPFNNKFQHLILKPHQPITQTPPQYFHPVHFQPIPQQLTDIQQDELTQQHI
ncbi:hypothetical protein, partial [Staphylococcus epidermidis]|uniref:hypothetical protein n=1 Tax=Staphylococcus epidermidis TaxID=1282 RepID=UPI0037DA1856